MSGRLPADRRHLVLVGGGHSHVQVLRRMAMKGFARQLADRLDVTLVVDDPVAVYSGMVPGYVAGQYQRRELEIDVVPLARLAGANPVLARAVGIDPGEKKLLVEGRPPIRYDLVSFDIGSTVAGQDLPGVREHALASRPISRLVREVRSEVEALRDDGRSGPPRVLVVGAGAGGVELAFTLRRRILDGVRVAPTTTLLHAGDEILLGSSRSLIRRVRTAARRWGIAIRTGVRVTAVELAGEDLHSPRVVRLADGDTLEADLVVWVAGARPHEAFDARPLPTDDAGFLSTRATLQVEGHDEIFAVGDCATLRETPTPKAGVYAVRQGPVLTENLERALTGRELRRYRPQSDFLALLNLGDGTAVGGKWGMAFAGKWVWRLKDRIDRKFMRRFQVLDEAGRLTDEFAAMDMLSGDHAEAMHCGGCAAKLEQDALGSALGRLRREGRLGNRTDDDVVLGLDDADDVAAWRTGAGGLAVQSVDAFRAFTDDPWLVGGVAAVNALSDVQAKGVVPRRAQALVGLPLELSREAGEEMLYQVLAGAGRSLGAAGVELLGGHTTLGAELWVGFAVDGEADSDAPLLRSQGPRAGDALVLTKPLGTGVLLHAHMAGRLSGRHLERLFAVLQQGNGPAGLLAVEHGASAATDVTGFGLLGHLREMLGDATDLAVSLDVRDVPALPGALELLGLGLRSTAHPANALRLADVALPTSLDDAARDLLVDPQTSGGLLVALPGEAAPDLIRALRNAGYGEAAVIGSVEAASRAVIRLR